MAEIRDDGGSIFQTIQSQRVHTGNIQTDWTATFSGGGLTIRDYFAAQALDTIFGQNWTNENGYADVARRCGLMADAMIAERKK